MGFSFSVFRLFRQAQYANSLLLNQTSFFLLNPSTNSGVQVRLFHCLLGGDKAEAYAAAAVAWVVAVAARRPAVIRIADPATATAHAERPR